MKDKTSTEFAMPRRQPALVPGQDRIWRRWFRRQRLDHGRLQQQRQRLRRRWCANGGGGGDNGDSVVATTTPRSEIVEASQDAPEIEWEMATSWPTALVTIFGGATFFTEQVSRLTGGRFKINARPAGEIVGGLEVLTAVRDGGVASGHTASYYYTGLSPIQQFGTAVPFGLNQRQQNAWLYQGFNGNPRGIDILNEFYAQSTGRSAFPRDPPAARWVAGSPSQSRPSATSTV